MVFYHIIVLVETKVHSTRFCFCIKIIIHTTAHGILQKTGRNLIGHIWYNNNRVIFLYVNQSKRILAAVICGINKPLPRIMSFAILKHSKLWTMKVKALSITRDIPRLWIGFIISHNLAIYLFYRNLWMAIFFLCLFPFCSQGIFVYYIWFIYFQTLRNSKIYDSQTKLITVLRRKCSKNVHFTYKWN